MYYHFDNHVHRAKYTSIDQVAIINHNMGLVNRFPFLLPRNTFSDEVVDDYDYTWTELDAMPEAWRKTFGEQMAAELDEVLKKENFSEKYRIVQIKEKFGGLRWYDNGVPTSIHKEVRDIIRKYEDLSKKICIRCGKPATHMTRGWITYVCEECFNLIEKKGIVVI